MRRKRRLIRMTTGLEHRLESVLRVIAGNTLLCQNVLLNQAGESVVLAGKEVPADGGAGAIKGAVFLLLDSAGRVIEIYSNTGDTASCNFDRVDA